MNEQEFTKLVEKSFFELEGKQKAFEDIYRISSYPEYSWDQEEQILQFNKDDKELIFKVVFLGSWSKTNTEWLWSWANTTLLDSVRKSSSVVKRMSETTGLDIFITERFPADESTAWELASLAVQNLDAIAAYRHPGSDSHLFLAIMSEVKK
jgi:NDP-sugar pyrophosphorylase family protein